VLAQGCIAEQIMQCLDRILRERIRIRQLLKQGRNKTVEIQSRCRSGVNHHTVLNLLSYPKTKTQRPQDQYDQADERELLAEAQTIEKSFHG